MAHRYYRVRNTVLGLPAKGEDIQGRDIQDGGVVTADELAGCGKGRCEQLVAAGVLEPVSEHEAKVLMRAQEVADAPGKVPGSVDDQSHLETLADELERPERERMAKESQKAKPPEDAPESPRVESAEVLGKKGR